MINSFKLIQMCSRFTCAHKCEIPPAYYSDLFRTVTYLRLLLQKEQQHPVERNSNAKTDYMPAFWHKSQAPRCIKTRDLAINQTLSDFVPSPQTFGRCSVTSNCHRNYHSLHLDSTGH